MNQTKTKEVETYVLNLIPVDVREKINLLNSDLYFGPIVLETDADGHDAYLNFGTVAREVSAWCDDNLPGMLWESDDSGHVTDTEPDFSYACDECDGDGCDDCAGVGYFESDETWWQYDSREIRQMALGRELANTI